MILEPPLSTGAGGRSPEKTSPGMVDRPSKRQGPGPGCGEVEDGVLAWHGGLDRPSVRTRPGDDRAGRSLRPSAGEKVTRSLGSTPTPCSSSLISQTLGAPWPARLQVFFDKLLRARRYPRCQDSHVSWKHDATADNNALFDRLRAEWCLLRAGLAPCRCGRAAPPRHRRRTGRMHQTVDRSPRS